MYKYIVVAVVLSPRRAMGGKFSILDRAHIFTTKRKKIIFIHSQAHTHADHECIVSIYMCKQRAKKKKMNRKFASMKTPAFS